MSKSLHERTYFKGQPTLMPIVAHLKVLLNFVELKCYDMNMS